MTGIEWKPARAASTTGTGKRSRHLAIVGVGLALALAGCGSSGGGSSAQGGASSTPASTKTSPASNANGVATASAELAKYTDTAAPKPPGPAFDASKASGKLVWLVEQKHSNPAIAIVAESITKALKHEHVQVLSCDAQGASVKMGACIKQGLAQHAAAIIADGGSPTAFSSGLSAANAAHVPVISALDVPLLTSMDASGVKPLLKGITADAAPPDLLAGQLAADFIVKDSNANAHVLFIGSPGIVGGEYEQKTFIAAMKNLCPQCTVYTKEVSIPNWSSDLGPVVTSQLATHPDINYVVPVFDPMANYTDPAILQAGKAKTVKVVTVNGSLQQMNDLAKGQIIASDIGENLPQLGFLAADQTLRAIVGAPQVKAVSAVVRVFTRSNVSSVKLTPTDYKTGAWYFGSPTALENMFYKLWSGGKG